MKRKTTEVFESIIAHLINKPKQKCRTLRFDMYQGMKYAEYKWNKAEVIDLAYYQTLRHIYMC